MTLCATGYCTRKAVYELEFSSGGKYPSCAGHAIVSDTAWGDEVKIRKWHEKVRPIRDARDQRELDHLYSLLNALRARITELEERTTKKGAK